MWLVNNLHGEQASQGHRKYAAAGRSRLLILSTCHKRCLPRPSGSGVPYGRFAAPFVFPRQGLCIMAVLGSACDGQSDWLSMTSPRQARLLQLATHISVHTGGNDSSLPSRAFSEAGARFCGRQDHCPRLPGPATGWSMHAPGLFRMTAGQRR